MYVDYGLLPYALAYVAMLAAFVAVFRRGKPKRPFVGVTLGLVALAFGAYLTARAEPAATAYAGDASCRDTTTIAAVTGGACRVEAMTIAHLNFAIVNAKHKYLRIVLTGADGTIFRATLATSRSGNILHGFHLASDRAAKVQFFRDAPVLVTTDSGVSETEAFPEHDVHQGAVAGLILALFALLFALVENVRNKPKAIA